MSLCQQKKSNFQKCETKQKRKMLSKINMQIHTLQTKTSRLAADYWLAPSLVLKLCQYHQVGMVLTWLQVRVYVICSKVSTDIPV